MGNKATAVLRVLKSGTESSHQNGSSSGGGGVKPIEFSAGQVPQYPMYVSEMSNSRFLAVMPRPLQHGDVVKIESTVEIGANEIILTLASGAQEMDMNNIVFQYRVNFGDQSVVMSYVLNGMRYEEKFDTFDFQQGGGWYVSLIMEENKIIVEVDGSYNGEFQLKHRLDEIRFMQMSGDIRPVRKLSFDFAGST